MGVPAKSSKVPRYAVVGIVAPHLRDQLGMLLGDRQMSVCPTPVGDRRQRAGVTLICRYLPHHILTLPRLAPYVAEAEKGERRPTRVRVVLAIWSVAAEIDEARLVGVERELVPSETLAQNIQNPLGILEVRERHHGSSSGEESHLSALTGRVGDWRAGLGRSLYSLLPRPFGCEVSQHLDRAYVSRPRHLERRVQISHTTLTCLLRIKGYGAYPAGATFGCGRRTR